ncbi:MAG: alpha-L-fucosidase [Chthoniobacterales bacterium]
MKKKKSSAALPKPTNRVAAFERLGFGLFLHWGLYSQMGKGEWIQHAQNISVREYEKLLGSFTASAFDASAIARLAKQSGAKYIVLTTRHHDGFSLYDTRGLSTFDAPHSPAGRDFVAEFVGACRAEGIVPFFYHTTLDWRWDSENCSDAKFAKYLDYLHGSVEVLCRHYGKIGGLWFDGNWSRPDADWKEDRLYRMIRKAQPDAMIIDNTGLNARGKIGHPEIDSTTFEQGLPSAPDRRGLSKYVAGEMCETLNAHWGIGAQDFRFKSPAELIERLCLCRKVGANYLLNVGPTAEGTIPDYEASVLKIIGKWLTLTKHPIYSTRPVNAQCLGRDFLLKGRSVYYYFAFDLARRGNSHVVLRSENNGLRAISGLSARIGSAKWLDSEEPIPFVQSTSKKLMTLDCSGYDYGTDLIVRVAELSVKR